WRGPESRDAGPALRSQIPRRGSLRRARQRNAGAHRKRRSGLAKRMSVLMDKRPALGKGLSALIPDAPAPRVAPSEVDIDRLVPNAFQPRGQFDDARLEDLAQSIKSNGVIQPIVVRKTGDTFQIIAGERRWRAAQKAGLHRVPVVVREVAEGQE